MKHFEFTGLPWNVVFGAGAVKRLPKILEDAGLRRALILSTPGRTRDVEMLRFMLGRSVAGTFTDAAVHVPAGVVAEARRVAGASRADCTISIGGGSTTGLGKLLCLEAGLPQIAIPTTYAGSEMTPIWGVTEGNMKRTGRDPRVLPAAVLYDPELLVSLPAAIAGPSALNAMAQAIVNVSAHPFAGLLAREAIRVLASGLPRVMDHIDNVEAHAVMLYGACLAGASLGLGRSGLHHRICHVLGGMYNLPHAETHAVVLPYSVAHTARTAPAEATLIGEALGVRDPALRLYELMQQVCVRKSLGMLGLKAADVEAVAAEVTAATGAGIAADAGSGIHQLLRGAFEGGAP